LQLLTVGMLAAESERPRRIDHHQRSARSVRSVRDCVGTNARQCDRPVFLGYGTVLDLVAIERPSQDRDLCLQLLVIDDVIEILRQRECLTRPGDVFVSDDPDLLHGRGPIASCRDNTATTLWT
jgi:hypothetical protein